MENEIFAFIKSTKPEMCVYFRRQMSYLRQLKMIMKMLGLGILFDQAFFHMICHIYQKSTKQRFLQE